MSDSLAPISLATIAPLGVEPHFSVLVQSRRIPRLTRQSPNQKWISECSDRDVQTFTLTIVVARSETTRALGATGARIAHPVVHMR